MSPALIKPAERSRSPTCWPTWPELRAHAAGRRARRPLPNDWVTQPAVALRRGGRWHRRQREARCDPRSGRAPDRRAELPDCRGTRRRDHNRRRQSSTRPRRTRSARIGLAALCSQACWLMLLQQAARRSFYRSRSEDRVNDYCWIGPNAAISWPDWAATAFERKAARRGRDRSRRT